METFVGMLSQATNSIYGTSTRSTLSSSASEGDSRSSKAGASYQVNDNALYGAEALESAGGNAAQALREAATNPHFLDQVGRNVGASVANEAVPAHGNHVGMDGQVIAQPRTVDSQHADGDKKVATQHGRDQSAAESAGSARLVEAEGHRAPMGAPSDTDMPSDAPVKKSFDEGKKDANQSRQWATERASVNGGQNRVAEAIFQDKAGAGRLLDASLGFGLFGRAQSLDEIRAPLKELANYDQPSRDRFAAIGNIGSVSQDDLRFLSDRIATRDYEKSGGQINEIAQKDIQSLR